MDYLLYTTDAETQCCSLWLALGFLLFTLLEPSFLSFLLMEYVLSKVNRLVFDRQLTVGS